MSAYLDKVVSWTKSFLVGMGGEYKEAWKEYPATLVWTGVIAFFLGALVL